MAPALTSTVRRRQSPVMIGAHIGNILDLGGVSTLRRKHSQRGTLMGPVGVMGTREPARPAQWRLKVTFWLDAGLLVSVCALQSVPFTGRVIHEWLGLAMVGLVLAHLLLAWSWIASQTRLLSNGRSVRARVNYLLNLTLFAAITGVIFSGAPISQRAVPAVTGARAAPYLDWRGDSIHVQLSSYLLVLAGFHLAINWDWTPAAGAKVFRRVRGDAS